MKNLSLFYICLTDLLCWHFLVFLNIVAFPVSISGQSMANAGKELLHPSADVLSDIGKGQATVAGEHLKDIPFTRAYSSDYPRALETANIVLEKSAKSKIQTATPDKRLQERGYTELIGQDAMECVQKFIGIMQQGIAYVNVEMPGTEGILEFDNRTIGFFTQLVQDIKKSGHDEETILVVSHGLTIQRMMILLNSRHSDCGIDNWTTDSLSEVLLRNTAYHQVVFDIPKNGSPVNGRVLHSHSRDHIDGIDPNLVKVGSLEDKIWKWTSSKDEMGHYCSPV